jgi:adenylate cyclase
MQYNLQLDIVSPVAAATLAFVFMIGRKYYVEYSEKKHIKSAFQHYVTASVVNEILKDPKKLNLHGEERNLTIFFSDIEGFTSLAEGMSPLDVVSLLNEYLTAMTDIIFEFNGLLDKYEGDAIMAVFGAPVDQSDHATRACRCALKNQRVLNQLRGKWHREGKPEMRVRIGINTGVVVVGNMGSTMRFDYTVIGDNVNLAARLEAANKIFNSSILVSEETAKLAEKSVVSRKIASLKAIGKSVYTNVYELLADKESDSAKEIEEAIIAKEAYEKADLCLSQRDFKEAEKILGVYLRDHENDLTAKILYSKIKGFLLVPPPADWQNVVTQEEK